MTFTLPRPLKRVPLAQRDPSKGCFPGFEFQMLFLAGLIGQNGEVVEIEIQTGTYLGRDVLFAQDGWDCVITAPNPGVLIDAQGGHPAFPDQYDAVWNICLNPATGKKYAPGKIGYSGTYGAKSANYLRRGKTKIDGTGPDKANPQTNIRITGYEQGTPTGSLCGIYSDTDSHRLWIDGVQLDHHDDAVRGHFKWVYFGPSCIFTKNGSGDGQSHGFYLETKVFVDDGSSSFDNRVGHNRKLISDFAHLRKTKSHNVEPVDGPSYDTDANGGVIVIEEDDVIDNPDTNPYSNDGVSINFSTARRPYKVHAFLYLGSSAVANVAVRGQFIRVQNPVPIIDPSNPQGNYHTAPPMLNSDGTTVNMPVYVLIDGCVGQYVAGKVSYAQNNWLVPNNNGIKLIQPIKANNILAQIGSPEASAATTHVDYAKLRQVSSFFDKIAKPGVVYTEQLLDEYCDDIDAVNAVFTYPTRDSEPKFQLPPPSIPAPYDEDKDPMLVAENKRLTADNQAKDAEIARLGGLLQTAGTDAAAKDAEITRLGTELSALKGEVRQDIKDLTHAVGDDTIAGG